MVYAGTQDIYDISGLGTTEAGTAFVTRLLSLVGDPRVDSFTRRRWSGQQTKEFIGKGDGTLGVFNTLLKPVLSALDASGGTVTTDPAHITLYQKGTVIASTNYTLIGDEGRIEINTGWEPDSGDKIEATYYYAMDSFKYASACFVSESLYKSLGGEESEQKADKFRKMAEAMLKPYCKAGFLPVKG